MDESPQTRGPRLKRKHLRVMIGLSTACFAVGTALAAMRRPSAFVVLLLALVMLLMVSIRSRR